MTRLTRAQQRYEASAAAAARHRMREAADAIVAVLRSGPAAFPGAQLAEWREAAAQVPPSARAKVIRHAVESLDGETRGNALYLLGRLAEMVPAAEGTAP